MLKRRTTLKRNHPKIAITVALLVLGFVTYDFTMQAFAVTPLSAQDPEATTGDPLIDEAMTLVRQVQAIKLDASILKDPTYLSLIDRTIIIEAQPVGRPNPFAPLTGPAPKPSTTKKP